MNVSPGSYSESKLINTFIGEVMIPSFKWTILRNMIVVDPESAVVRY
jgi:hypothetical protein